MANIRKRAKGWHVQIRKKGYDPIYATFDTKAEAERWAKQVESDMARSRFVDTSEADALTISDALARYEREISVHKKSYRNERSQLSILSRDLGHFAISQLRGSDVATYRDERLNVASGSTVRRNLALLSHLYTIARKEWGLPVENPCANIRPPKLNRPREQRATHEQVAAIIEQAVELHAELPALIVLAVETGMRRGELMGLTRGHIRGKVAYLPETKNGGSRTVPLSTRARAAIQSLPKRMDGRLFSIHPDTVSHYFPRAVKAAGYEGIRFHDLRHEATSRFFELGFNIMEVAAITGHKDMQMLKRYTHLNPDSLAERLG